MLPPGLGFTVHAGISPYPTMRVCNTFVGDYSQINNKLFMKVLLSNVLEYAILEKDRVSPSVMPVLNQVVLASKS